MPIYIGLLCLITFMAYRLSHKSIKVAYNLLLAMLFVGGVVGYTKSAPVSVFSLSLGFGMALFQVLTSLGGTRPDNEVGSRE